MLDFEILPRFKKQSVSIFQMIPVWAKAFQVDEMAIMRQIPIAHAWADSNSKKAPKKNMIRFLFNWMTRAQKFGNLVAKSKDLSYKESRPEDEELLTGDDFKRMRETISAQNPKVINP